VRVVALAKELNDTRDLAGVLEQEEGEGHHGCPPNIIRGVRNRDMQ
jgi:hypothetical protein